MSDALINRSADLRRLDEEGFELEIRAGFLLVHGVPYVKADRSLARGTLLCALTLDPSGQSTVAPGDHTAYFVGDMPCHRDGQPLTAIVNSSARQNLGNGIEVDHYLSSKPEGTGRYESFYEKMVAYVGHIQRPAQSHDRTADARTGRKAAASDNEGPFQFPDTASARYGLGAVNHKLELRRVAIIGLGGTGSYVLDLVAKTPVEEIHLYDDDQFLNHNLFRAPGAPEPETLKDFPSKVAYFAAGYGRIHGGVTPHPVRITTANVEELAGFDFAFVCVDKGSARRAIADGLHRLGIPFIDTGIGVELEAETLDGCVRVTFIRPEMEWVAVERLLPFGDVEAEDDVYDKGIQIADLNSLNAALAVLRWKRWVDFYRDERGEANASYMIEGNLLTSREG
jgi:hypothetical protein